MKNYFKIIGIGLVLVLLVLGIVFAWKKFSSLPTPSQTTPTETGGNGTLPISGGSNAIPPATSGGATSQQTVAGGGMLQKISDGPVFDYWVNNATKEIFYVAPDGKVLTAKDDADISVSTQKINALNAVQIAPGDQKILASFGDPRSPSWGIFDIIDKTWKPLPSTLVNATWGSTNAEIFATIQNGNAINLASINIAKATPVYKVFIKDFRLKDVRLSWSPKGLIISENPSASYTGRVWLFDTKKTTLNLLFTPEAGSIFTTATNQNFFLKFSSPNKFEILDKNFAPALEATPLYLATLPSKCGGAASSTFLYCFSPQSIPPRVVLPDDYFQNAFFSTDNLFVINLGQSEIKKVLESGNNQISAIDGYHPSIIDNDIYFINRFDNFLYRFRQSPSK